jgi:hypothetical protein
MQTPLSFRHARLLPVFAAMLAAGACSSRNGNGNGGSGGSTGTTTTTTGPATGTTGTGSTSSTGGAGGSGCPAGPGYTGTGAPLAVTGATATVVDTTGAPISGLAVFVCGLNICTDPASTNASGSIDIVWNLSMKPTQPAFKFGDSFTYPELAIPITTATSSFPNLVNAPLPTTGAAFTPGGNAVSGGVTLAIPAGDVVTVNTLDYETPAQQLFRAVQLPVAQEAPVIMPSGLDIGILVGVTPLETTFCPAVGVTVPNTAGWPAGTAVEFYLHGVSTFETWSVYGGWTKVSDGQVSADGTTVSTAAGAGFPVLETFAVVQAQ